MDKKKNGFSSVVIAVLVLVLAAVIGFFGYQFVMKEINGSRKTDSEAIVYIKDNSDQYSVGQELLSNEIIGNETVWSFWMDRHYKNFEYQGGEYYLNSSMSYEEIAQKLKNPDVAHKSVKVCIPEGYNIFKIASTLEENGICPSEDFLAACSDKTKYDYSFISEIPDNGSIAYPLEGFLFPATYDFEENENAVSVADKMLSAFADRITPSWKAYCTDNNMTIYELVTLASVVEKETLGEGVAQRIASVFINRLDNGQQLQSDVTIDYGNALRAAGFADEIVFSYNTYKCPALPSGPICNPGVENIDAVINHEDTDYLYFFSYNNGADFYFTDNYTDFSNEWAKLGSTNTN